MRKAETPPLSQSDTLKDGLRLMLGEGLDHLADHLPAVRGGDMEAIHQMRVAMRRLRSTLKLLRRYLAPVATDGFDDALRRLGQALGAARDWDVFVVETLPAIQAADPAGAHALDQLIVPAQRARDAAHRALQARLDSPHVIAVLEDLRLWSTSPDAFFRSEDANRKLSRQAPRMLDRLANRARRRARGLAEQDDEERHDLRKALKALRYGIQMLESLYDPAEVKPYRKALSTLQEDLGQLNDAIAAVELARRLLEGAGREVVTRWSDGKKRAALEALPASWTEFSEMPVFWSA